MHSCACRCSCLPQGPWVCVHCIRARMPCNACVRRRIHSTCMHIRRSCSRNHILSRTTPRGIPYDDAAWIPSPVGWGDLVDCGFLRRAAKDRRLLLHVLRARLELARLLPCRVGYHVVWDTIPCLPWHAASHAMRDTVPCESPCRVGYRETPCLVACHDMSCLVTCHAKRDTMLCRMPVFGISYRAGYAPCHVVCRAM